MNNNFVKLSMTISDMRSFLLLLVLTCGLMIPLEAQLSIAVDTSEVVVLVQDSIEIAGTLTHVGKEQLVVVVAGSGPTDRDCNSSIGLKSNAFKMLADSLAYYGVSSYRYDKRGVGKSSSIEEEKVTIYSFVDDLKAIVAHFVDDYDEIIVLGHSEGSLLGLQASADMSEISAMISVCGAGQTMDKIILDQIRDYTKLVPLAEKHIEEIKQDQPLFEVNVVLKSLFRESIVPFLKSVFVLDPVDVIRKVEQPILIIGGSCDIQVPTTETELLHQANPKASIRIIEGMGHVLKDLNGDCKSARSAYNDESIPINPQLIHAVIDFIKSER